MNSTGAKRSIIVADHKTSISLENEFRDSSKQIASVQNVTLSGLVSRIDSERQQGKFTSAVRLRPLLPLSVSSPRNLTGMKAQQRNKIQEIRSALMRTGFLTLDQQAKVLGLSRSTAWSVLKPNHKSSGLSARTINRILASPRLPVPVRQKIFEYTREKIAGLYGHNERRRREFAACLSTVQFNGLIAEARGREHDRRQQRIIPEGSRPSMSPPRAWLTDQRWKLI
jgi:predicted DNA-binding ribbon-helix-helix protein/predicted DNA-binding transcriptional regulator AlpA